jgi:hypothetical protein
MNPRGLSAPHPAEPAVAATEVLTADEAAALLGVSRWTLVLGRKSARGAAPPTPATDASHGTRS